MHFHLCTGEAGSGELAPPPLGPRTAPEDGGMTGLGLCLQETEHLPPRRDKALMLHLRDIGPTPR